MSLLLFDFVKAKKKAQLDGFCTDGGFINHDADSLCLKSHNLNSLNTIYATLTTEVSSIYNINNSSITVFPLFLFIITGL